MSLAQIVFEAPDPLENVPFWMLASSEGTAEVESEEGAGGWKGQLMGCLQASVSPQSHDPPDCWATKKDMLCPV
jgi:hypothetical protein